MPADFLTKILEHKQGLLKTKKAYYAVLKKKLKKEKVSRYGLFKKAIAKSGQINLIAEIKKASPSAGVIRTDFNPLKIAKIYADSGAAAFSILTEEKFFQGTPFYMKKVGAEFNLPILAKDFFIDEVQIYEAFYNGAGAILLIAAILTDKDLKHLMKVASDLDIDTLVEVHNEEELARALKVKAEIIGINNRNLDTLEVDMTTCEKLIPQIPKGKIIVAESGIKTHKEVAALRKLGAHAVLIGETFLRSPDIGKKVKDVMHGS